MLFNKINTIYLTEAVTESSYNIDEYICIQKHENWGINIYIDNINVANIRTNIFNNVNVTYYYKIPRAITKKINSWAKNKINKQYIEAKNKKAKELDEKKKIEQHFKELYK